MAIDSEFYEKYYPINDLPHLRCPQCGKTLSFTKDDIKREKSGETKRTEGKATFKAWHEKSLFHAFLQCPKQDCRETVSMSGIIFFKRTRKKKIETEVIRPLYVFPVIQLFEINFDCPDEVLTCLEKAFLLYWNDYDGCANKIRIAVEYLLSDQGVNTYNKIVKGKRKTKLTLHDRIERFGKKNPDIAKSLMAIKWIGNAGSHVEDVLTHDDILTGFELFELVLIKLYSDHEPNLLATRDQILKAKRPLAYY